MTSLQELEWHMTLPVAVARYNDLRLRHSMSEITTQQGMTSTALTHTELLEALSLAEVIRRKIDYGHHLFIHSALREGTSWSAIAAAQETTAPEAWDRYERWIQQQQAQHRQADHQGFNPTDAAAARRLAGTRPEAPA